MAGEQTAAEQFGVLSEALTDIMGSAATTTVLRRAAKRAIERAPELAAFAITREQFEYRYVLPPSWRMAAAITSESFQQLLRELRPLLMELTGSVVLHRLRGVPELERSGLFAAEATQ